MIYNYLIIGQMYPYPDHTSPEPLSRSVINPGLKHSMVLSKGGPQGLTFGSKSQANLNLYTKKDSMSKSFIKKDSNDIDSVIREIKDKITTFERTLSHHDRQISEIRESRNNSFFSSTQSFYRAESSSGLSSDLLRNLRKQFEDQNIRLRSCIFSQIDALKSEIRDDCVRKFDLEQLFVRFQSNISSLVSNNNVSRQISQLRNKIKIDCQALYSRLNNQMNAKTRDLQECNSKYFSELNLFIDSIKNSVENLKEEYKPSFTVSNQKCYSPKLIKYKQVLQKLASSNTGKPGEEVVAGEVTYYLDREGFLLDANHYYLLDKNNKQIKLDYKQLTLFNMHDLMK